MIGRRLFFKLASGAAIAANARAAWSLTQPAARQHALAAGLAKVSLVGDEYPPTEVMSYNGEIPGPVLRLRKGEPVQIDVRNDLVEPTSVHWHGIPVPNAMDGVAGLTQAPIAPGEIFSYAFTPRYSGTYWYHSHFNTGEQIARGLAGPLIVEDDQSIEVDRELVWMLDDWRLLEDASISDDFRNGHDRSHAGRLGNVPTLNGEYKPTLSVRSGERLRIRIINAANARNFALNFDALSPHIIAIDGQPVTTFEPDAAIVIPASGRRDIVVDMTGDPGSSTRLIDNFYRRPFAVAEFAYGEDKPLRDSPLDSPVNLQANAMPEPQLSGAFEQTVVIEGGAMGGLSHAMLGDEWFGLRELAGKGYMWALNQTVADRPDMKPLFEVERGRSVVLSLQNKTAFPHPMHLHGHHMKLIDQNGIKPDRAIWHDTVLVNPDETVRLAFVADNPGRWLFHCHVLEHHAAGMGALVVVS